MIVGAIVCAAAHNDSMILAGRVITGLASCTDLYYDSALKELTPHLNLAVMLLTSSVSARQGLLPILDYNSHFSLQMLYLSEISSAEHRGFITGLVAWGACEFDSAGTAGDMVKLNYYIAWGLSASAWIGVGASYANTPDAWRIQVRYISHPRPPHSPSTH
jgi:MFS family permease